MMTPEDIPFIDSILSFLSSNLPHPIYSFLITFLSHSLALLTSLLSLLQMLWSTKPWEWDAQTLMPPIVGIFAAYLALVSLYRTTSWMVRVSIWFVKWGVVLGALIAAVGWYASSINGVAIPRTNGFVSGLGGLLADMLWVKPAAASRSKPSARSRTKSSRERMEGKPKPWQSFEQHRRWQQDAADGDGDVQKIIGEIVGAAGRAVKESGWWDSWEAAKGVVEGVKPDEKNEQTKSKVGRSKGSR